MSTYNILKDAPAAGVQKNPNFQQVGRGTASESANSGTRDAKKKCVDKNDPLGAINALLGDVQVTDVGSRNLDLHEFEVAIAPHVHIWWEEFQPVFSCCCFHCQE